MMPPTRHVCQAVSYRIGRVCCRARVIGGAVSELWGYRCGRTGRDMAVRNGVLPTASVRHSAPPASAPLPPPASAPPTTPSVHVSELCYPEDPFGFPQLYCPHTGQAEGAEWIYIPRSGFGFGDDPCRFCAAWWRSWSKVSLGVAEKGV
eukprot:gene26213-11945_t